MVHTAVAFQVWSNHYNGPAKVDKHTKLTKGELQLLYYKNEKYMSLKLFSGKIKSCYLVINKNLDERLLPRQQVTTMLSCIHAESPELQALKTTIHQNYVDDFAGVCTFFLAWCPTCMVQYRSSTIAIISGSSTSQQPCMEDKAEEFKPSKLHQTC